MNKKLLPLWVILDLLLFLAVISLWITAPEFKTLNIGLTVFSLSLGVLLLLIHFDQVKNFLTSTYFNSLSFHGFNIFLVLSILGLLNYLSYKNAIQFDLSKDKKNTLTEQSQKIVNMIDSPLSMTLYAKREEWEPMLNLLKLFEAQNKNIKLEAIDTDIRLDLVKEKNITQNGTIILTNQGKETSFPLIDELSVTNALLKAIRSEKIVLYFTTGHQELSCLDSTAEGISEICNKIKNQNYEIKDLDLTKVSKVPVDANSVIILGPISGFLKQEVNILQNYLNQGGSLIVALAPSFKDKMYDSLIDLMKPFGLTMGKDIVIDRLSTVQGAEATIPIVSQYEGDHPIINGFTHRTVFPLSSSVQIYPGKDTAQILVKTSSYPGSWAETDLKAVTEGKAQFDENKDLKGPVGLLGISEGTGQSKTRVMLLGSSSFLINAYQNSSGNSILFMNALAWVINDEGVISFNRPDQIEYPVILSAQHLQMIFFISILLVPILFFGAAIFVYRRRRVL